MFGVKSIAAVTIFALLYGFFSGASAFIYLTFVVKHADDFSVASLYAPVVAGMARHPSEVGLVEPC